MYALILMSMEDQDDNAAEPNELEEGIDYYVEGGLFVFTRKFLLKRGYCCESGCRHCPYEDLGKQQTTTEY